jgi:primosomal replication protein N
MKKPKIETIGLGTIQTSVSNSDIETARTALCFAVGASVDVSGVVLKRVKRAGECKLVIEPGNAPGFVVFADCLNDAETVRNSNIRKGSRVSVRGKLATFGASAVCLSDCRLR